MYVRQELLVPLRHFLGLLLSITLMGPEPPLHGLPIGPLMELRVELMQHPAPRNYPILVLPRDDADPSHGDSVELTNHAGFLFIPESSWLQPLLPLPGFLDPWVSLLGFCLSSPACTDRPGTWAPIPALCTVLLLISSQIQMLDGASCPGTNWQDVCFVLALPSSGDPPENSVPILKNFSVILNLLKCQGTFPRVFFVS